MPTNVYIDGLNLYYGALKDSAYRWLDIRKFAAALVPQEEIKTVSYFTARMGVENGDGSKRQRQDVYLRALDSLRGVEIQTGIHRRRGASWEEKKTDVNIATAMIFDAFNGVYDHAVLVSNDSDFVSPIQRIHKELGLRVTVANPVIGQRTHRELLSAATGTIQVSFDHLRASQLPPSLRDSKGRTITKPRGW